MGEPSPLRNPLGTRGSACVEVMTTLHGSTQSPWRRAEGCVPSEVTIKISFLHVGASVNLQSCLVTIGFGYPFLSLLLV
ncbi:hypothetical protein CK203_045187 [Vitis vinifera]|uniref:Uncharacterized protein n=1 Tax=Vitis vinifera TaxID=29760 RepID=A0A438H473_VITVI|nr:hypothetical protein CK203_045187 [Vitis vinifera]